MRFVILCFVHACWCVHAIYIHTHTHCLLVAGVNAGDTCSLIRMRSLIRMCSLIECVLLLECFLLLECVLLYFILFGVCVSAYMVQVGMSDAGQV